MDDREALETIIKQIRDSLDARILQVEMKKDLDKNTGDVNHAYEKIRDIYGKLDRLEDGARALAAQIEAYKNWLRGAYAAVSLLVGVIIYLFAQTGALSRIFGGGN